MLTHKLQCTLFVLLAAAATTVWSFTPEEVKCHVCKATILEMEEAIARVDPNKRMDVSGFRLDPKGNTISKTVKYAKSEVFLTELMENICKKMEDYLRATHKKTKRFMLLKMVIDGQMNPASSEVDFVQDSDLNKSLEHYCLEIVEDAEDVIMRAFQNETLESDLDIRICSEKTSYCDDLPIQEDYEFDKEEL